MTTPMYTNSVPVFKQLLTAMKTNLQTTASEVAAKAMTADAFLQARLYPDMFPLVKQVQIACEFARGVSARLARVAVPVHEGDEATFADLDALLDKTLAFIDGLDAAAFEGSEAHEIVLRPGTPKERKLGGQAYLSSYGLPQFFFHVTTTYAILRHNGVPIGKKDYMGAW